MSQALALADYLEACRVRLKRRSGARGAAALALGALVVTGLFAWVFVTFVPAEGWVVATRLVLYMALIAGAGYLIWRPLTDRAAARAVETVVPDFDGRLATWRDATVRGDDSPMLTLLTRETESIARTRSPASVIPTRDVALPAAAAIALSAAVLFLAAGVSPWQLAAQRLWTGELFTASAPRITVEPGDTVVPRGADVVVEAEASGFMPRNMELHAAFEEARDWETAPMSRLGEGRYGFVFVGVTERVEYYVGAAGLNSSRHVIHVADLPKVTEVALRYTFPDWTGLPEAERHRGDVAALPGTAVAITATTDQPLTEALIVVNDQVLDADVDPESGGLVARGAFQVGEPGTWHVAVRHEGTLAQISDTFFIDVVEDQPPAVAFSWPGHDTQATAIEERTLRFTASDDYGVKSLALHYAVNGGAWQPVTLVLPEKVDATQAGARSTSETAHTLYLEDLRVEALDEPRALRPGDLITFYAEAHDHAQEARTALYFVDVRPFDRTYRENQANVGSMGGQSGGPQELVDRQREILSATWNLINKQADAYRADTDAYRADADTRGADADAARADATDGEADASADQDAAEVLALLQDTLKEQVTTLTQRAAARRLTLDDGIDTFTQELTLATEAMGPAAEHLQAQELQDAIAPEQQALQHLLAAQATVTDVDVSLGQANVRGTAGRSLSELIDLEMDTERNRYETEQQPGSGPSQEETEEWRRLSELASRQEELTNQQRMGADSLASRWQQERLQRELEELQRELERRRQQQGSSSQRGANGQAMENAIAELDRAQAAIDRSLQRQQGDPAASRSAREAIERAAEQLRQNAIGSLGQRLERAEQSAENLLADQRNIMDRLEEIQDDALDARRGERRHYDDYAMEPYAERKRRMQEDLNDITREISALGGAIDDPETAHVLDQATAELARAQVGERLAASADAFEFGRPLYAIGNEGPVERALERLTQRLGEARRLLQASEGQDGQRAMLAEVRALRAELGAALAQGASTAEVAPRQDAAYGAYDSSDMEALVRRADALEFRLGQELGPDYELDTTLSREAYLERGTDAANNEALAQLMKDRLDLMEAALRNPEAAPIRAQQPRDEERDSEAAARYFRELGRSEG